MKILVMGLPGSGKTTFTQKLKKEIYAKTEYYVEVFNGDEIREAAKDWDFSMEGRIRQAVRMRMLYDTKSDILKEEHEVTIFDFVCPLKTMRNIVEPDIVVFMDTIKAGRFEDTNAIFIPPENPEYHIKSFEEVDQAIESLISRLSNQSNTDING